MGKCSVYDVKYFYRGRQIRSDSTPGNDFTASFLDHLTMGMIHPGWSFEKDDFLKHACDEMCALESYLVIGRPFVNTVKDALKW